MKKKFIAAVLAGAVMISGLSVSVMADKEKTFVYGTTGYSEEMGDAGLNLMIIIPDGVRSGMV